VGLGADREMWGVEVDIEGRDEHVVSRGTKVRIVEGLVVNMLAKVEASALADIVDKVDVI
jgi:hypothetical protein